MTSARRRPRASRRRRRDRTRSIAVFVPLPWLIVAGVVALVLVALALRPRGGRGDLIAPPSSLIRRPDRIHAGTTPVALSPEDELRVRAELRGGRLIGAIKLARDATGLGLKESKELVEAMQRHDPAPRD